MKNRRPSLNRRRKHLQHRRAKVREWFKAFKSSLKCCVCGEDHPACLEFHHVEDNKFESISFLVSHGFTKEQVLRELKKCSCVCANCHRKIHAGG